MPQPAIDESTLEIPDPRPYILGAMAGTTLIATAVTFLIRNKSDGAGAVVADIASGMRAPRVWTRAFSESDSFLGQIKDITPSQ